MTELTELEKLKQTKAQMALVDWAQVVVTAQLAAALAADEMITKNPNVWYPCGFAWVNIKPARGKLVQHLKDNGIGYTDDYYGGYTVMNPAKNSTQWMDAKIAGARAFADELKKHGIKCNVGSRMD